MHPILAMGDIATPVLFDLLLISDSILLVSIVLLVLSLWKPAALAVGGAISLLTIVFLMAFIWMSMAQGIFDHPLSQEFYKTPGLIRWCRVLAVAWWLAIAAIVFCFVKLFRRTSITQYCRIAGLDSLATPKVGLVIGVMVTPIFLLLGLITSDAGHGNYLYARIFYPIPTILMVSGAGWVAFSLAILQYPFFGWFISRAVSKKQFFSLLLFLGIFQVIPTVCAFL